MARTNKTYHQSNDAMVKSEIVEQPANWLDMIDNIRAVRKKFPAPVDTMGCDQVSRQQEKTIHERFQVLVSLMLSSQTKDPITWAAVQKLREHGICNVDGIIGANEKDIEDLIYPVGFYRRKAIYLKKVAQILKDSYDGDIPNSLKELCSLPGVGPKMAHLCMNEAWNTLTGIGVDTHVHRISARLGWVPSKGIKTPEDTRKALESWMPREYWSEINHLLVGFGQTICTPVGPKCDQCFNQALCPYFKTNPLKKSLSQTPASSQTLKSSQTGESLAITTATTEPKRKLKAEKTTKKPKVEVKLEPKFEQGDETTEQNLEFSGSSLHAKSVKIEPKIEPIVDPEIRVKIEWNPQPTDQEPEKQDLRRSCRRKPVKQEPRDESADSGVWCPR